MSQTTGSNKPYEEMSTYERLQTVKKAIFELTIGGVRSYMLGTKQVTYYNLDALKAVQRELEAELEAENARDSAIFGTRVTFFDRR